MRPLSRLSSVLSVMLSTPVFEPSTRICTPWKAMNAARVTTKDGMPMRARSQPSRTPATAPKAAAPRMASGQATPCFTDSTAPKQAALDPTTPADRSISPRSSTKIRPMARKMVGAPSLMIESTLLIDEKPLWATAKRMNSTMMAATAGSEPISPLRTLRQ